MIATLQMRETNTPRRFACLCIRFRMARLRIVAAELTDAKGGVNLSARRPIFTIEQAAASIFSLTRASLHWIALSSAIWV
jgi:hypothetical protein